MAGDGARRFAVDQPPFDEPSIGPPNLRASAALRQLHARLTAIGEGHAGGFEGRLNSFYVLRRASPSSRNAFHPLDRWQ